MTRARHRKWSSEERTWFGVTRQRTPEEKQRRGVQCPICLWSGKKQAEFKAHWKERHNTDAGRAMAKTAQLHVADSRPAWWIEGVPGRPWPAKR